MFFTTEPQKTGENFRETSRAGSRQRVALWRGASHSEKIGDLVVDLSKLLDELSALMGGQLEGRSWYLVRFDDIDTA